MKMLVDQRIGQLPCRALSRCKRRASSAFIAAARLPNCATVRRNARHRASSDPRRCKFSVFERQSAAANLFCQEPDNRIATSHQRFVIRICARLCVKARTFVTWVGCGRVSRMAIVNERRLHSPRLAFCTGFKFLPTEEEIPHLPSTLS